ncbi:MAG: hypothetical protein GYB65_08080 [Chloroflexi bacterium]|nr:hypothetical protein [Chloroflexota bacterium]
MIAIETPHPGLVVSEVLGGSTRDIEDMIAVHLELFGKFEAYVPYMRERALQPPNADPGCIYHWWLARIADEPAAVRYFKYIPARHVGLSLGVAVRKKFRPLTFGEQYGRFSNMMILTSLKQVQADAEAMGNPVPLGIAAEVEEYLRPRYAEYNFIEYAVDYQEPSSTPDATAASGEGEQDEQLSFRPIQIGLFKLENTAFDPYSRETQENIVKAFLIDHYELPVEHWAVQQALRSIQDWPEAGEI